MVQSGSPFIVWMVFYVMGVLKAQGLRMPVRTKRPLVCAAIGIFLSCIHIAWLHSHYGSIAHGIKLSSHLYTYFVILWLFSDSARLRYDKVKKTKMANWMNEMGKLSFFIYLTHCLILFTMQYIHIPRIWSVKWLACTLLSYMFAKLSDKICPAGIKKYIGL